MSHSSTSPEQRERELELRRELEALGEPPPSDDELALFERDLEDDPEIATVSRLVELSAASESTEPLSELELHRAWRNVEQRTVSKPAVERSVVGSRRWLIVAVGLAAAAGVLFIVIGPERDATLDANAKGPSREQVAEMSEQVHATLQALDDGKSDSERAAELAADYQRRLKRQEQDG